MSLGHVSSCHFDTFPSATLTRFLVPLWHVSSCHFDTFVSCTLKNLFVSLWHVFSRQFDTHFYAILTTLLVSLWPVYSCHVDMFARVTSTCPILSLWSVHSCHFDPFTRVTLTRLPVAHDFILTTYWKPLTLLGIELGTSCVAVWHLTAAPQRMQKLLFNFCIFCVNLTFTFVSLWHIDSYVSKTCFNSTFVAFWQDNSCHFDTFERATSTRLIVLLSHVCLCYFITSTKNIHSKQIDQKIGATLISGTALFQCL